MSDYRSLPRDGTHRQTKPTATARLSPRESEFVNWLYRGYTYQEIADLMGIRYQTVKNHGLSTMIKLGAMSRAGMIRPAIERGYIKIGEVNRDKTQSENNR